MKNATSWKFILFLCLLSFTISCGKNVQQGYKKSNIVSNELLDIANNSDEEENLNPLDDSPTAQVLPKPPPPSQEEIQSCLDDIETWQEKYAAKSPIAAYNKNSSHPITEEYINQARNSDGKIKLTEPVIDESIFSLFAHNFSTLTAEKLATQQIEELELKDSIQKTIGGITQVERFSKMNESIIREIYNSNSDELVVVFAGAMHAIDLLSSESVAISDSTKINFIASPFKNESPLFNKSARDFQKAIRESLNDPNINISSEQMIDNYVEKSDWIKGKHLTGRMLKAFLAHVRFARNDFEADTYLDSDFYSMPDVIFLSDVHLLNETSHITEMPSPRCWSIVGKTKIKFLLEGVNENNSNYKEFIITQSRPYNQVIHLKDDHPELRKINFEDILVLPSYQTFLKLIVDEYLNGTNYTEGSTLKIKGIDHQ